MWCMCVLCVCDCLLALNKTCNSRKKIQARKVETVSFFCCCGRPCNSSNSMPDATASSSPRRSSTASAENERQKRGDLLAGGSRLTIDGASVSASRRAPPSPRGSSVAARPHGAQQTTAARAKRRGQRSIARALDRALEKAITSDDHSTIDRFRRGDYSCATQRELAAKKLQAKKEAADEIPSMELPADWPLHDPPAIPSWMELAVGEAINVS